MTFAGDMVVHSVEDGELHAFARFTGFNMDWPPTVEYKGNSYSYVCNEVMPYGATDHYSGYSKYRLIER